MPETTHSILRRLLTWAAVFLSVGLVSYLFSSRMSYDFDWGKIWQAQYRNRLIQGWWLTVWVSLAALLGSTVLGLALMFAERSGYFFLSCLARFYVEVFRGTPLLVQILFGFYVVLNSVGFGNKFWSGVLLLSCFTASYLSEIFRAGIESVPKSQIDSARALGFTSPQIYRHVIFPQAIRQVLPSFAGQSASLIKDSSLLSIIALSEFSHVAQEVNSKTFKPFETYLPLALGYLILTLPISAISRWLERRMSFEK